MVSLQISAQAIRCNPVVVAVKALVRAYRVELASFCMSPNSCSGAKKKKKKKF